MLVTVFGVPTEFSMFGVRILRALVEASLSGCHYVHADTLETLRQSIDGKKVKNIILYSEFPEKNIVDVTSRISKKCVVFYESAKIVVEYSKFIRNMSYMDCVRFAGKNIALIAIPIASKNSLIISNSPDLLLDDIVSKICDYLEILKSDSISEYVAKNLGLSSADELFRPLSVLMPLIIPHEYCHDRAKSTLTPEEIATLSRIVLSEKDICEVGIRGELVWDGNLFFMQNKRKELSAAEGKWIEMLGPSRFLYFGPYLFIPPGDWSIKAEFRVRGNQSGNRAEFDIVQDGTILALSTFDIPASGIFEVTAELVNEQPEKPLEFRVHMREGAIDGQFVLDRVRWRHGLGAFQL
ncbi:MAG: hypothetical protein FD175_2459 [Beijerinckiaceae bacterium]|nr:MAG: hypothetical protein FD175_2459 [Beijerinckiaceae bacterium]